VTAKAPSALETISAFATAVRFGDLPKRVQDKVRTCLTDALWGCLHVHHDSRAQAALRIVPLGAPGARSQVLTSGCRAYAADAAFVGAIACAATDRSDTHLPTATHPGIIVIPALIAALQDRGGSGEDLGRGIVIGYEVMGRIARAVMSPALASVFRPTAVAAPVAAAVAVAAALRLEERAIVVAGSLAAQTAIGFNEWARAGTGEHAFHAGFAARNAVTCAYLAAEGSQAAATALDGPSGLLAGYASGHRSAELTFELGRRFEIDDIAFKPAPACFFAQTPIQVAAAIAGDVDSKAIERIDIRVTATAATYPGCAATDGIDTMQAAVMSIPFAVASTLRAGRLDPSAWTDFGNPETSALAKRCNVEADEVLTAAYPARNGAAIEVRMRDGRTVEAAAEDFVSMDAAAVSGRFRADAEHWIGRDQAETTLVHIAGLERLDEAGSLAECCATASGQGTSRRSSRP
jgi:2-methylcitrate dehydratase PrpD